MNDRDPALVIHNQHLLWFRPLSPLNYAVPSVLACQTWSQQTHVPIEQLTALPLAAADVQVLKTSQVWFLSSPTAADCLARALKQLPLSLEAPQLIATVGQATLEAWQAASGPALKQSVVSSSGESMGLYEALRHYPHVSIVRAQTGREDLPRALGACGVEVSPIAIYKKRVRPEFASELNAALERSSHKVCLCFTSSEQVRYVLAACDVPLSLLSLQVWVSHARVAVAAQVAGFTKINIF